MVQHQNIEIWNPSSNPAPTSKLSADDALQWKHGGSIAYKGACDEVDLWVTSVPTGDNRTDLTMLFNEETLPREVAEKLMSVLTSNLEVVLQERHETVTTLSIDSNRRLRGIRIPMSAHPESEGGFHSGVTPVIQEPRQETYHLLQTIWCRVLGLASETQFVPSDSFYTQGGDSIGAAMVAGLAQAQGIALSLQDTNECVTFGEQVQRIEDGSYSKPRTNSLEWDKTDRIAKSFLR
jgi:hypothetical protein